MRHFRRTFVAYLDLPVVVDPGTAAQLRRVLADLTLLEPIGVPSRGVDHAADAGRERSVDDVAAALDVDLGLARVVLCLD
jgi:hypothetical protein